MKCHILYDSIYLKCAEYVNPYRPKEIIGCQEQGQGGHRE